MPRARMCYTLNNSLAVVKQLGLGETLTDTFTYTVTDNHGGTATNTLTVTVNGINTPPLTGTITAGSVTEDTSTVLTGIMTAPPDPNPHDTVVFLPQLGTAGAYGTLTLAASGRYTYVLNNTLPAVPGARRRRNPDRHPRRHGQRRQGRPDPDHTGHHHQRHQ